MFDYIHCKSVGHLIYGKIFFRKEVPCHYFHSGNGERIPALKNIQENNHQCKKMY